MLLMFRRRHAGAALATLSAFSVALAGLAASSGTAAASVGSDQTNIAQLEQQIAAQGAHAQALVSRYNEVQAHVNALDALDPAVPIPPWSVLFSGSHHSRLSANHSTVDRKPAANGTRGA